MLRLLVYTPTPGVGCAAERHHSFIHTTKAFYQGQCIQVGLKLKVFLPQASECWNYRNFITIPDFGYLRGLITSKCYVLCFVPSFGDTVSHYVTPCWPGICYTAQPNLYLPVYLP